MKKIGGPRAQKLATDKRPHDDRLRELYLSALSRPPTARELADLRAYLAARPEATQAAYEDVLWALLNTKEFLFNH
ncbi:MAG: hypothetical protein HYR84_14515 [Planctomycetes bacterium]|nr:hypothetical protein [Planctomycetota bacterium]